MSLRVMYCCSVDTDVSSCVGDSLRHDRGQHVTSRRDGNATASTLLD
jgi:hypothetical protein